MGLFGFGGKKNKRQKQAAKASNEKQATTSPNRKYYIPPDVDLDHLAEDGELPIGWYVVNKQFTQPIEAEYSRLFEAWYSSKQKSVLDRYAALKSLVLYMEDVKTLCATKGECFAFWSETLVADPIALNQRTSDLRYMEEHMDELIAAEKKQ